MFLPITGCFFVFVFLGYLENCTYSSLVKMADESMVVIPLILALRGIGRWVSEF